MRDPALPPGPAWHAATAQQALERLDAVPGRGLAAQEAARRLAVSGPNALAPPQRRAPWRRLLAQFHNVLIYVLLGAAATTALLGHLVDSGVIAGVVVINALIGFLQEGKAERALDAIRNMLPFHAQVLRDGRRVELDAQQLVPGDIVYLASGDKVPADLRLLDVHNLRIEEAALTGESVPAEKQLAPVDAGAALGDHACMAYSGTLVASGQGTGLVVATGTASEIGRISDLLASVEEQGTPLLRQLAAFGRRLTVATLLVAALAFAFGTMVRNFAAADMFLAAVGLAVALIPEGLPAIMTITLAIGVERMARRHAIIRRLPAVETLGSVTVICTDKTGTLTRNEMTARRVLTARADFAVTGVGYAPRGGFALDGAEAVAAQHPVLADIARPALLCNDAALERDGEQWRLAGDPTEGALVSFAMKAGLDAHAERAALPRIDAIPFESEHRFMATLHHDHAGGHHLFIKGAPEAVLALGQQQLENGAERPLDGAAWQRRMDSAAASGLRLLALARRRVPALSALRMDTVTAGQFTLLGVLGLEDPPREEAVAAVARCRAAGIRVKMITGDHLATACAIGQQVGLGAPFTACTGAALAAMDDAALAAAAASNDVFARASPEDKLRLVVALQARGDVVAMTGDGVNDAPALKQADVGVAMGARGTEAAKEAAEMVLADDNFASIAAAIEEGRGVYDNIRKAIVFILPTNGGEAGMLLVAIMLGLTMPVTPVQILWINMVTAVTLALALAFETTEAGVMARPPRDPREPVLTGFLMWRIGLVTTLMVGGGIGLFLWELQQGASLPEARCAAVNAIVMGEIVYLFNVRRTGAAAFGRGALDGSRYALGAVGVLVVLQLLFTYLPAMQQLFGTAPPGWPAWLRIAGFGAILFAVVELEKVWLLRSRR
ncbi:MAG TPA: HAD-IC family P-type ATPase [Telluria sp.]